MRASVIVLSCPQRAVGEKQGEPVIKPLFPAWLESKQRRTYREVVFCPPPLIASPEDYNLWKGFALQAAPGQCSLFLEHLREVICSGVPEHYDYLLNLLALTVKEPGTPSEVAVVLRGDQGTGKGTFVRALGRIFGRHFIHLDNVKHLVGGFNAALSGKVIVFADEAFWAGNKSYVGALKRLITEPTLTIERKGIDAVQEANHVHLFMATNEEWAVPAQLSERRFFALHVSAHRKDDHDYFTRLETELTQGGLAAFLDLLHARQIDRTLIRQVPKTEELREQQAQTLPSVLEWWQDCLHEGCIDPIGWPAYEWVRVGQLYELYELWAKNRRPITNYTFGKTIRKYAFQGKIQTWRVKNYKMPTARCGQLRTITDARNYFDAQLMTGTDWPEVLPTVQGVMP